MHAPSNSVSSIMEFAIDLCGKILKVFWWANYVMMMKVVLILADYYAIVGNIGYTPLCRVSGKYLGAMTILVVYFSISLKVMWF